MAKRVDLGWDIRQRCLVSSWSLKNGKGEHSKYSKLKGVNKNPSGCFFIPTRMFSTYIFGALPSLKVAINWREGISNDASTLRLNPYNLTADLLTECLVPVKRSSTKDLFFADGFLGGTKKMATSTCQFLSEDRNPGEMEKFN